MSNDKKFFKKFYIEITNVCNLACSFCPVTKRKPEFMDLDTFQFILGQIKPYTKHLYFHIKGEPLLHPKIDQFLDLAEQEGFLVNITSNGTLAYKVKDKLIGKAALRQINLSLHSYDGNPENKILEKETYISQILDFTREVREKTETLVSYRFWNLDHKDNPEEQTHNDMILSMLEKEYKLPYQIKDELRPGNGVKLADGVYVNQDYEFRWPALSEEADEGIGFCHGLRNQIGILVDGTVVPCCLDGEGVINLGNVKESSFTEILDTTRVAEIIDGFSRRLAVEELCKKCGYRKKFAITKTTI